MTFLVVLDIASLSAATAKIEAIHVVLLEDVLREVPRHEEGHVHRVELIEADQVVIVREQNRCTHLREGTYENSLMYMKVCF